MKLEDIVENALLVKPDDTLPHVISRMTAEKRYEAFVFDVDFKGIVTLDDIIKRKVSDPQKMKISYFMKPATLFPVDAPIEDIMNYMLVSEFRSVPVEKDGKIFAVTKPRLLKFVKDEVFAGKKARDVMQFPYCASTNDTLLTVTSMMRDSGMNRIPIVDDKGRLAGIADSMSLAGMITERERARMGERDGEKLRLGDIEISKFVISETMKVSPDTDLKQIIRKISDEEIFTVVVEDNEKFMGLITIKDIFKLIGKSAETVYIRVSGLGGEDEFVRAKIDKMIENTINKMLKFVKVTYVAIHVEIKGKGGKRTKYSVQGRFMTNKGSFYASDHEWEPIRATKLFLEKIEGEMHKRVERKRGY